MKITLELETGNITAIERSALNILLGNIKIDATGATETPPEATNDAQPESEVAEEKKEATEAPKRKRRTTAQIAADKESEEKTEAPAEEGISLTALKNRAKDAVAKTDRVKVKAVISEFAEKLAEVDPADYGFLYKKLGEIK